MTVVKRDNRVVVFDRDKIKAAVTKAFLELYEEKDIDNAFIDRVANEIAEKDTSSISVEEIQDIIEKKLMASRYKDVAKAFILYRNNRTRERDKRSSLRAKIKEKLQASNVENQNANVDEKSFGGRMGAVNSEVLKDYALNECMCKTSRENHENNIIYEHDLDHYALGDHNCLSVPLDDLLANGFNTRQTDVRPARSVNTAFQLVAVLFQLQSLQQFGGVSATHLDHTMVPYVRLSFYKHYINGLTYIDTDQRDRVIKELNDVEEDKTKISINNDVYRQCDKSYRYAMDMTRKEVYQAVEGFYHNLNTLQSRSGNQLPFSSINYGTCTLPEGRMVIEALLSVSIKGIGRLNKTPIFPCGIFQCMKGVNREKGSPNYDLFRLALKSTAKRLYPNYANVDWSNNAGYDVNDPKTYFSTMGCRTANLFDINGFGQLKDGRGNICPVTIILPTVAMMAVEQSKKNNSEPVDEFMSLLDKKIQEARDMLIERFNFICSQSPDSAKFMYENGLMAGYDGKNIISALKHGTLAIGQLGVAETLQILIGCDHTTPRGMEVAKKIEGLFKTRCSEYKNEYKLNFAVYYTPAENLCYTAMKKFKEKYGVIENVSDKEFFTNSMHVPVWREMTPFEKIDIESELTGYSSAGCITYVELPSTVIHNIDALEEIVNYAMDKDIPYFAVNVPNDMCANCGFTGEINDVCPKCGGKDIKRLRRVTGLSNNR